MLPPVAAYIGIDASRRAAKKRKDERPFRARKRRESSLGWSTMHLAGREREGARLKNS
jgi:hypothetical protein